jgi:hypothetical protein
MNARFWRYCVRFVLILLPTFAWQNVVNARDQGMNVDDVINRLATAERQLVNLKVDGTSVNEILDKDGKWKETIISADITAWLNGMPGGPATVDVHRAVMPWSGDNVPAPFLEESYLRNFTTTIAP